MSPEAVEIFCWEDTPFFINRSNCERAKPAELFANYNVDASRNEAAFCDCDDAEEDAEQEPDIRWEYDIGSDSASWVMTLTADYPYEYIAFPALFIKKEELKQ